MFRNSSRRLSIVLFALFASFLVVSAMPVSAADGDLVVGSEHTTDSDFQNATLTNTSIDGSGSSASVVLSPGTVLDNFDDGDLTDDWTGDIGTGSRGTWTTESTNPESGSFHAQVNISSTSATRLESAGLPQINRGDNVSVKFQPETSSSDFIFGFGYSVTNNQGYEVRVRPSQNTVELTRYNAGSVTPIDSASATPDTSGYNEIVVEYGNTIDVTLLDSSGSIIATLSAADTTYDYHGYKLTGYAPSAGDETYVRVDSLNLGTPANSGVYISPNHNATNPSEGRVDLTLSNATADVTWQANVSGTWTNVTSTTYSTGGTKTAGLSSTSADEWRVRVDFTKTGSNPTAELGRDAVYFPVSTPSISAGTASPTGGETIWTSTPTLSVDVSDEDLSTAQGDELTLTWRVNGSIVDTTTASTNGTKSITAPNLPDGSHTWSVTVNDSYGETVSSSTHSFDVQHYEPVLDNSSLTPADGSVLETQSPTISIDVTDGDFGVDGDQLTAEFFVNNESIGTDTLTSNGTASYNFSGGTGGENTVYVRVTDQYGQTVQSQTNTFSSPSNLSIYNESNPTQLLTNLSEPVTLRFYYENGTEGQVVERQTTNGTISLEGLPVDQSFVVVANAPGYLPRRVFVSSLLERQSVYLLPDSEQHVENLFTLSDFSGDYDKTETVLIVQRSLNGSWETVQGDYFGATGEFSAQLAYNVRHRLILRNTRTGQEKVVGPYTPLADGSKNIKVTRDGDIELALDAPRVLVDPSVRSLSAVSDTQLIVDVSNQTTELSNWSVEIVYQNETATQTLYSSNQTSATGGTVSPSLDLSGRAGGNVTVTVNWSTVSGGSGQTTATFIVRETFTNEYGLLPVLGTVTEMIPAPNVKAFTTFISIIVSVLVATGVAKAFPASTELVGVSAVGTLAFFSVIEWVGVSLVFVSGMTLIAFAALRRGL